MALAMLAALDSTSDLSIVLNDARRSDTLRALPNRLLTGEGKDFSLLRSAVFDPYSHVLLNRALAGHDAIEGRQSAVQVDAVQVQLVSGQQRQVVEADIQMNLLELDAQSGSSDLIKMFDPHKNHFPSEA